MHSYVFPPRLYIALPLLEDGEGPRGRPLENIQWSDCMEVCMPGIRVEFRAGRGVLIDYHVQRSRPISKQALGGSSQHRGT